MAFLAGKMAEEPLDDPVMVDSVSHPIGAISQYWMVTRCHQAERQAGSLSVASINGHRRLSERWRHRLLHVFHLLRHPCGYNWVDNRLQHKGHHRVYDPIPLE